MKNLFRILLMGLLLLAANLSKAQQWGMYTLYSVGNSSNAYLIDTNNTVYHTWTFANAPTGYSTYLLPGQVICRSVKVNNNAYTGGGLTGRIQKVDWSGNVIWDYTHSSSTYMLHHDHCPLPNGNVLMISYENKTAAEVSAAGCTQSLIVQSEKIIEVQPTGANTGTIVWEWHLWDHLVQNVDANKANYQTSISAHPELMNINYGMQKDWWHMNGIDYDEARDQIVVSSHNMSEIYVIDHSTTTAEAASHAGGTSGKGGDFLYRWGNPQTYSAGTSNDKILKVCHDAHFIPTGSPHAGRLVAFNNDGISTQQSAIDQVETTWNGTSYDLNPGPAYLPATYTNRIATSGHSSNMGNSEQFPNGNMLICMATTGLIYEIDPNGTTIWSKQVTGGSVPQAHRYTECFVNGGTEPTAQISASQDSICAGDSVALNLTPGGGTTYTYAWGSSPAGFSSTDQNPTVTPSASTTYFVTVTSGGCATIASVGIAVVTSPTPTITQSNDTLYASAASGYQWYFNGNAISGATSMAYVPTQSGNYTVVTTNAVGCASSESAPVTVTITAIDLGLGQGWKIYPNPTQGVLKIVSPSSDAFEMTISDASGRRCLFAANTLSLDLSTLPNGLYFLHIAQGGLPITTQKVVLQR